jgi:hypothetical protein
MIEIRVTGNNVAEVKAQLGQLATAMGDVNKPLKSALKASTDPGLTAGDAVKTEVKPARSFPKTWRSAADSFIDSFQAFTYKDVYKDDKTRHNTAVRKAFENWVVTRQVIIKRGLDFGFQGKTNPYIFIPYRMEAGRRIEADHQAIVDQLINGPARDK